MVARKGGDSFLLRRHCRSGCSKEQPVRWRLWIKTFLVQESKELMDHNARLEVVFEHQMRAVVSQEHLDEHVAGEFRRCRGFELYDLTLVVPDARW